MTTDNRSRPLLPLLFALLLSTTALPTMGSVQLCSLNVNGAITSSAGWTSPEDYDMDDGLVASATASGEFLQSGFDDLSGDCTSGEFIAVIATVNQQITSWVDDQWQAEAYIGATPVATISLSPTSSDPQTIDFDFTASYAWTVTDLNNLEIKLTTIAVGDVDGTWIVDSTIVNVLTNTPPTANAQEAPATEDTAASITLTGTDADNNLLTFTIVTGPSQGVANLAGATVTYTPNANFNGVDSFTFTVNDGNVDSAPATVTITVANDNDAPTMAAIGALNIAEDGAAAPFTAVAGDADIPTPGDTLAYSISAQGTLGVASIDGATGVGSYLANANAAGVDSFNVSAQDATGAFAVRTVNVAISPEDDAPTAVADAYGVNEDELLAVAALPGVLFNDSDPDGPPGTVVDLTCLPATCALPVNAGPGGFNIYADGSFDYAPVNDFFGPDTFQYRATNGGLLSDVVTVTLTVQPVNDAPSFTAGANIVVPEDSVPQTVTPWAAGISNGDGGTLGVDFVIDGNTNGALFSAGPAISPAGTLTYTPAANANGVATISVYIRDDGGVLYGGVDASATQSFTIEVTPLDDALWISDIADSATVEDLPTGAIVFTVGGAETSADSLSVTGASSDPDLVPNTNIAIDGTGASRTVTITPAPNQSGSATITVTVDDDTTTSDTFVLTVNEVNDAPTITAISNPAAIDENAVLQTVNISGITEGAANELSQTLTITAISDTPGLIPNPTVSYTPDAATGSLTYTPVTDQFGSAIITVTVMDSGSNTAPNVNVVTGTFTVVVNNVNNAPTLTAIADPTAINEDAAMQTVNLVGISEGPAEAASQSLVLTASSSNTAIIPNPTVVYTPDNPTGGLTYTPVANAFGSASITVTVTDSGSNTAPNVNIITRTFTVVVSAVPDAPTISTIPDSATNEDTPTSPITFTIGDAETAATALTVTATSGNPALVPNTGIALGGTGASRTATITPLANQFGTTIVTITVSDGTLTSSRTFVLTVTSINDVPSFTKGADQTVAEDSAAASVSGWATALSAGPSNEAAQTLTFITSNNNNGLFSASAQPSVGTSGTLTFTPAANINGAATVSVQIRDTGGGVDTSAVQTFTITVNAVNDGPSISVGTAAAINQGSSGSVSGGFSVSDPDSSSVRVTLSISTGSVTLGNTAGVTFTSGDGTADASMTFSGPISTVNGALSSFTATPASTFAGTASLTASVDDLGATGGGSLTASGTVSFLVPADTDLDGLLNTIDNCPTTANVNQLDSDSDGVGDLCDPTPLPDADHDGDPDVADNCVAVANANQLDTDNDGAGDACDTDLDGDGSGNTADNCPNISNSGQANLDGDLFGDACDTDIDGDGTANSQDAFPNNPAESLDTDQDGTGNNADTDDDADGVLDATDNCPLTANNNQADKDADAKGDLCDLDNDNDGTPDALDAFPNNPAESKDSDGDGLGNNIDPDDDNDGIFDTNEIAAGTNPLKADTDDDGLTDKQEADIGSDGTNSKSPDGQPRNVRASADGTGPVEVTWNADNDHRLAGFDVYRASEPVLLGRVIFQLGVTSYEFQDDAFPGGQHAYYVQGIFKSDPTAPLVIGTAGSTGELTITVCQLQSQDTDQDGICDAQEMILGTNPALSDSDGDGIEDAAEIAAGTDPKAASRDLVAASGRNPWGWVIGGLAIVVIGIALAMLVVVRRRRQSAAGGDVDAEPETLPPETSWTRTPAASYGAEGNVLQVAPQVTKLDERSVTCPDCQTRFAVMGSPPLAVQCTRCGKRGRLVA